MSKKTRKMTRFKLFEIANEESGDSENDDLDI